MKTCFHTKRRGTPLGEVHRLASPGSYLGEDNIVRFEDTYGRAQQ